MTLRRKPYRSDLSDAQWNRIRRLLPKPAATGRPREDDREIINGILYVMWTGCRWEDLPHDIDASPKTCNRRLLEYQRRKVWQKIVASLMKEAYNKGMINLNNCYHDASVIKSKRGRTTKSDIQENTVSKA
jgi:transposase